MYGDLVTPHASSASLQIWRGNTVFGSLPARSIALLNVLIISLTVYMGIFCCGYFYSHFLITEASVLS